MSRSQITVLITMLACGCVIVWQYAQNAKLKRETGELKTTLNAAPPGRTASALTRPGNPSSPRARSDTTATELKAILSQQDPMSRIQSLLAYVENLPPNQIERALEELRAGSPDWDPESRFLAHMLLTRWGQEDPEAAFASLKNMDFQRSGGDATSILASLAALNPQRAVEWLNDPENTLQYLPTMGHILAGTIAKEWVRQDPEAAMAWADSLPDDQRRGALGGVIESLASTDPKTAASMVLGMESDQERHGFIGEVSQSWGRQDPREAIEWAASLQGVERQEAIEEILDGWAQSAPSEAAAYVDSLPPEERTERQISEVAREWARRDPAQAAAWLDRQPEGEGRQRSMGELMWNWTTIAPEEASSWLSKQPIGESRDLGAAALAKAAFEADPEGAVSWVSTISNEEMRDTMIEHGLREWIKRDPTAANAWAKQNGVDIPQNEPTEAK